MEDEDVKEINKSPTGQTRLPTVALPLWGITSIGKETEWTHTRYVVNGRPAPFAVIENSLCFLNSKALIKARYNKRA